MNNNGDFLSGEFHKLFLQNASCFLDFLNLGSLITGTETESRTLYVSMTLRRITKTDSLHDFLTLCQFSHFLETSERGG